jgi:hypothetical protein
MIIEALRAILLADSAVTALAEERHYPVLLPDAPTFPATTIQQITGQADYTNEGDSNLTRARVQIDVFDTAMAGVEALSAAVKRALSGYTGNPGTGSSCLIQGIFCINTLDLAEPITERSGPRVRRRLLEFTVWIEEI